MSGFQVRWIRREIRALCPFLNPGSVDFPALIEWTAVLQSHRHDALPAILSTETLFRPWHMPGLLQNS